MKFTKRILFYSLTPLLIFMACLSFYRFIVTNDYIVGFEGPCNPETHSCFIGCNDDACTDTYYFAKIERKATLVKQQCGPDVANCAQAETCLDHEKECTFTYCKPQTESSSCSGIPNLPSFGTTSTTTDSLTATDIEKHN